MNNSESQLMQDRDPNALAGDLIATQEADSSTDPNAISQVCLNIFSGKFRLSYRGDIPPKKSYDWVGLFKSVNDPDDKYVTWFRAKKGKYYQSRINGQTTGYETRYFIWKDRTWVCIRKSGPLNGQCGK